MRSNSDGIGLFEEIALIIDPFRVENAKFCCISIRTAKENKRFFSCLPKSSHNPSRDVSISF